MRRLVISSLSAAAAVALLPLIAAPASAACTAKKVTTGNKTLTSGQTDANSFFTLTKGKAIIEAKLSPLPNKCKNDRGISFEVISDATGSAVECHSPGNVRGPARNLRCDVDVLGGTRPGSGSKYFVRVNNPTACTVKYQNVCRNK